MLRLRLLAILLLWWLLAVLLLWRWLLLLLLLLRWLRLRWLLAVLLLRWLLAVLLWLLLLLLRWLLAVLLLLRILRNRCSRRHRGCHHRRCRLWRLPLGEPQSRVRVVCHPRGRVLCRDPALRKCPLHAVHPSIAAIGSAYRMRHTERWHQPEDPGGRGGDCRNTIGAWGITTGAGGTGISHWVSPSEALE